jgi:CheY-like chemotaxis protein
MLIDLRAALGNFAAIAVVSAHEESLEQCLELGADTMHTKPVSVPDIKVLFDYALKKRQFLHRKRRRVSFRTASEAAGPDQRRGKGAHRALAQGRIGETHLGVYSSSGAKPGGYPVVIKLLDVKAVRGPSPP